ncbi:MAG: hypothetical protein JWP81_4018 [Ferruginibacter sp.]|nr:hypothetical protein [Ferruginibacter sp.]
MKRFCHCRSDGKFAWAKDYILGSTFKVFNNNITYPTGVIYNRVHNPAVSCIILRASRKHCSAQMISRSTKNDYRR